MKHKLFYTKDDWTGFILRLTLGVVFFPHGAQKLLGWFGGDGFGGTMSFFTDIVGLPWIIAFLVIILESIGAFALIFGAATRLVAASYIVLVLGMIYTTHIENGFFMNWYGSQLGEGFEYHLLVIGIAMTLIYNGGGKYALDRLLAKE